MMPDSKSNPHTHTSSKKDNYTGNYKRQYKYLVSFLLSSDFKSNFLKY